MWTSKNEYILQSKIQLLDTIRKCIKEENALEFNTFSCWKD